MMNPAGPNMGINPNGVFDSKKISKFLITIGVVAAALLI